MLLEIKNLELSCANEIKNSIDKASRTTNDAITSSIITNNSLNQSKKKNYLISRWLDNIDQNDIEGSQQILDHFGYEIYSADCAYPNKKFQRF